MDDEKLDELLDLEIGWLEGGIYMYCSLDATQLRSLKVRLLSLREEKEALFNALGPHAFEVLEGLERKRAALTPSQTQRSE